MHSLFFKKLYSLHIIINDIREFRNKYHKNEILLIIKILLLIVYIKSFYIKIVYKLIFFMDTS